MKNLTTVILALLLTACSPTNKLNDVTPSDLVGVWSLKYMDGNAYPYNFSQLAFTKNGTKCVLSYNFNRQGELSIDYYKNTYTVESGVLITKVGYSSGVYGLPKGYIIKDKFTHFDESSFNVFMVQPKGNYPENHQRLIGVNPETVCEVVERHIKNNYKQNLNKHNKRTNRYSHT